MSERATDKQQKEALLAKYADRIEPTDMELIRSLMGSFSSSGAPAEDAKREHWRQWAIDGMPADKIRLAEATWKAALSSSVAASADALRYRRIRENWIDCDEIGLHGRLAVVDARIDELLNAAPQGNEASASTSVGSDSGCMFGKTSDSTSRGLPNNPAAAAPYDESKARADLWKLDGEITKPHQQAARDAWVRLHNFVMGTLSSATTDFAARCRPAVAAWLRKCERDVLSPAFADHYKPVLEEAADKARKLLDEIDAALGLPAGPDNPPRIPEWQQRG